MFLMQLGVLPLLLWSTQVLSASVVNTDAFTHHIHSVIGILEDLEFHLKENPELVMKELFQELECCKTEFCQLFLGSETSAPSNVSYLSEQQSTFLKQLVTHKVNESLVEHGVVLTPDGTTVSLSPLLAGITVGLKRQRSEAPLADVQLNFTTTSEKEPHVTLDPLLAPTLAMDLGISFLFFHAKQQPVPLGPDGCWDSISEPHKFTLMGPASLMPDAFINGAMDGIILGSYLAAEAESLPNISALLNDYYSGKRLENGSHIRSNFRRKNFAALVSEEKLKEQVKHSLHVLWSLNESRPLFEGITDEKLMFLAKQAAEEFMALYVECPAIIPRCMWGAKPYRGTPTQLILPLDFVYIHHTHTPAKPCQTFPVCAANMRSMQRFHQDIRGWDDIGYSFVAGNDGYLYQGRGWHWVGAHTKGYNSKGYGVSFIGDYMEALPATFAMELVKNNFMQCAVRGQKIKADYVIHGHRQMGQTLCPGDRLFDEIKTWKHFRMRCFMDHGVYTCI